MGLGASDPCTYLHSPSLSDTFVWRRRWTPPAWSCHPLWSGSGPSLCSSNLIFPARTNKFTQLKFCQKILQLKDIGIKKFPKYKFHCQVHESLQDLSLPFPTFSWFNKIVNHKLPLLILNNLLNFLLLRYYKKLYEHWKNTNFIILLSIKVTFFWPSKINPILL